MSTFQKYAKITSATRDIRDFDSRCRVIDALKREAKHTVFSDLVLDEDSKHRLYYCIRSVMEESLRY